MTIAEIKQANYAAGQHFFERSTMRFFSSTVLPYVYNGPGGIFFVTSEQFHGSQGSAPRRYTVRQFMPETAEIKTFGPFNKLDKERARKLARTAARDPETSPNSWIE
jgi:hypothetical protein